MSRDSYDDLLGPEKRGPNAPPAPGKRKRGRPTKVEAAAYAALKAKEQAEMEPDPSIAGLGLTEMPDVTTFHRPVTRTFLATMLGKEPRRLVAQLAKCPVIGYGPTTGKGPTPLYDFKEAIRFCVDPPVGAIDQWIRSQSSTTLPPLLNKAYWDAMRSRQMVEERAKDLWRTEDVLDVLGRTALTIKDTAQLWIENLPGKASMTSEQYEALRREVAALLDDIHQRLVAMPAARQTRASVAEIEETIAESMRAPLEEGDE